MQGGSALSTEKISLRHAVLDDLLDLFKLANDPFVRNNSFSNESIAIDEHTAWFKNVLNDKNIDLYISYSRDNAFIAQTRFNKIKKKAIISIAINEHFRGKGLSQSIIQQSCRLFLTQNPEYTIEAQIKDENIPSQKSFEKANFSLLKKVGNILYYEYGQKHA